MAKRDALLNSYEDAGNEAVPWEESDNSVEGLEDVAQDILDDEEEWSNQDTSDVYYESDADWHSAPELSNDGNVEWEGDSLGEEQNEWPLNEPWKEPDINDWVTPGNESPSEEPNEEHDENTDDHDCSDEYDHIHEVGDDESFGNVEGAPYQESLPSDIYSEDYVEALKRIGIKNIAVGAKGITYSFYTSAGQCKSPEDIQRDVSYIQNFEIIRIYDTDCDGLANILKSMGPNQKVFAGIHYPEVLENSVEIINNAIQQFAGGDWNKIHTISIGNEMVNFGKATPAGLQASIEKARGLLSAKGYNGPIVTTDTLVAVLNNKELCRAGDYIAVNSHPYWDGAVPAQQAGPWLVSQLQMLDDVCERNGKQIFLAETGWPHTGKQFGQHGAPSKDNQLVAIKSIVDSLGPRTILFTTFNDYWKDGGSHDVEKFWGIFED